MNKKFLFGVVVGVILILVVVIGAWFFLSNKDSKPPVVGSQVLPSPKNEQYNWSTMDEGPYKDKVSFATSKDLLNWTDSGKILVEHASVPGAIIKDGVVYVYFVDVSEDGKPEQIGLIKSADSGKTWSDKMITNMEGIGDKVPVDPAPFVLGVGKIRLYYFDISTTKDPSVGVKGNKMYSAISSDGVNFTQEEGFRFAKEAIFDPDVIKVGNTWRMYVGNVPGNKVVSATSSDGLTFKEEGIAYEGGAVPDVYYEGGTYYLYTAGIDIATSKNGATFTRTNNFFRSQTGFTADPSVIKLPDETYLMFYKTKVETPLP